MRVLLITPRGVTNFGGEAARVNMWLGEYSDSDLTHLSVFNDQIVRYKLLVYVLNFISSFLSLQLMSFQSRIFYSRSISKRLLQMSGEFDVIVILNVRLSYLINDIYSDKIVFDMVDVLSHNYSMYWHRNKLAQFLVRLDANLLKKQEVNVMEKCSRVVVISRNEKTKLIWLRTDARKIEVKANRFNLEVSDAVFDQPKSLDCYMAANWSYFPNAKTLQLLRNIKGNYEYRMDLLGPYIEGGFMSGSVVKLGFVEEYIDTISKYKFCMVAIDCGGGVQNKLIEGLFVGANVVTTSYIAQSLDSYLVARCYIFDTVMECIEVALNGSLCYNSKWARECREYLMKANDK